MADNPSKMDGTSNCDMKKNSIKNFSTKELAIDDSTMQGARTLHVNSIIQMGLTHSVPKKRAIIVEFSDIKLEKSKSADVAKKLKNEKSVHKLPDLHINLQYKTASDKFILSYTGLLSCASLMKKPLFLGIVFHVRDHLLNPNSAEIQKLLIICGGKVLNSIQDLISCSDPWRVEIVEKCCPYQQPLFTLKQPCIIRQPFTWIQESLLRHKIMPFELFDGSRFCQSDIFV